MQADTIIHQTIDIFSPAFSNFQILILQTHLLHPQHPHNQHGKQDQDQVAKAKIVFILRRKKKDNGSAEQRYNYIVGATGESAGNARILWETGETIRIEVIESISCRYLDDECKKDQRVDIADMPDADEHNGYKNYLKQQVDHDPFKERPIDGCLPATPPGHPRETQDQRTVSGNHRR